MAPARTRHSTGVIGGASAVAAGLVADRVFGEPPPAVHPVAGFGQGMARVERALYRDSRVAGMTHWAIGVGGAVVAGRALDRMLGRRWALLVSTYLAVAGRMLGREATAIGDLLVAGNLEAARARLPALVGRSPTDLSESEITRAVVESVAENSVDAVVAPVLWALVAGAPGVCAYRAINTLDAMVGHRSPRYEQFGWASARLDDLANWIPARVGAVGVAAVRPGRARAVVRIVRRDAAQHPSPNGGVIESAFAASLGIRLGGSNRYGDVVEHRGVLGDGREAAGADIGRAVRLLDQVTVAVGVAGLLAASATTLTRRLWRGRSRGRTDRA